jgi:acetylornithine deacetylase/succinyl-diaminopimelate desuccinylase-like protein
MDVSVSPADSEIVRSFQRAAEKVVGFTPKPRGGSHSSDHGYFVTRHGKPVASYGIGGVGTHMANEHTAVEDIMLTTKVYALTMLHLLGAE